MDVTIRRARPEEARGLSDVALRSKGHWGYDPGFLERAERELTVRAIDLALGRTFVAERDGAVVGFYGLEYEAPELGLAYMFVEPRHIGDCESMEPSQSPDRGSLTLAAGWPMASWLPSTRGVTTPQNRARSASGAGQLGVVVKSSRNRRHIRRNLDFQRDFTRQSPPTVAFADSTP